MKTEFYISKHAEKFLVPFKMKVVSSYSPTAPAGLDKAQTVQAVAGEVGDGKGVLGGGIGVVGEVGRLDHWTAGMGTGRASVSVAQNRSEEPNRVKDLVRTPFYQCYTSYQMHAKEIYRVFLNMVFIGGFGSDKKI